MKFLILFSLLIVFPKWVEAKTYSNSARCFQSLVKKNRSLGKRISYHTLANGFIFPKSFVFGESGKQQGFYLVHGRGTEFCPFKFSVPSFGANKAIKSKFQIKVGSEQYSMTYNHSKRKFSSSTSIIGKVLGSQPVLRCKKIKKNSSQPLKNRIEWLVNEYKTASKRNTPKRSISIAKSCL